MKILADNMNLKKHIREAIRTTHPRLSAIENYTLNEPLRDGILKLILNDYVFDDWEIPSINKKVEKFLREVVIDRSSYHE